MTLNALAALANPASIGERTMQGFNAGHEIGQKGRVEKALRALAADPMNEKALQVVESINPELGAKYRERMQDQQFNNAAVEHFQGANRRPGQGAPVPAASGPQVPQQQNAMIGLLPPVRPGASFGEAFAPMGTPAPAPTSGLVPQNANALTPEGGRSPLNELGRVPFSAAPAPAAPPSPPPGQAAVDGGQDFAPLGPPQSQEDAAFLRMLKIDAKRAFEIDSQMRDRAADRLKIQRDAYGLAVSRFGGVTDEAGYQAALADIARRIEPLGVEVTDHLPPQFPGVQALREIRLGAIEADDRLRLFMSEANIVADNERQDRSTDSLIEDREARRGEQRRVNEARLGIQERGLGLRESDIEADNRRADAAAERTGRNTESLIRSRRDRTGGRTSSRSAGSNDDLPLVRTPAEARRLPKGTRFRTPDGAVKRVP